MSAGFSSAAEAAERFGWSIPTYSHHENGTRGIRPEVAKRYARALKVDPSWLLYGTKGPDLKPETVTLVPVVGEVRAGAWTEVPDQDAAEEWVPVAAGRIREVSAFSLRVRGRSMDEFYPDGSLVLCIPAVAAGVRVGDHVVVRRRRAELVETTLKEVVQLPTGSVELVPRSTDPAHQARIPLALRPHSDEGVEIIGVVIQAIQERPARHGPLLDLGGFISETD